jgi:hypothetical protein
VDLYIHFPIRLHGVVLNYLSTGTILPLPFYVTQYGMVPTRIQDVTSQKAVLFTATAERASNLARCLTVYISLFLIARRQHNLGYRKSIYIMDWHMMSLL